jgi:transformation/transcription domain-associated protein
MSTASIPDAGPSVVASMDWELMKQRLLDENVNVALEAAKELRERIEIVHTAAFSKMLSTMVPVFASVLTHKVRPNADATSAEHKVRNNVLEVLSRLPNNEVLRPHAPQMLVIAMDVLTNDYEENALLASRITFDLHKNYRQMPQDQVQPYLEFVTLHYRSLPTSVQTNFLFPADQNPVSSPPAATPAASKSGDDPMEVTDKETPSAQGAAVSAATPSTSQTPPATILTPSQGIPTTPPVRLAPKSSSSFRVLTECPLTVMLLFQLYPKFLKENIQTMLTLMIEALGLRAPPLQSSQAVDSGLRRLHSSRSRELVAAQVKTLSFLTQFLKGFAGQLKPYEDRIASNVVSLMTSCPHESIGTRRELLHATRHILATDFRKGFYRHVDSLLDERVLMGSHPQHSDQEVLRPLGYSTLADLVHHARSLLSMKQLSRVVYIFSRVVHDSSLKLPLAIQTTAVRLLLNLVDTIFNNKEANPQPGRDLLARILDTLVRKLGVLKDYIPVVEKAEQARKTETSDLDAAVACCKSLNTGQECTGDGNPSNSSSKIENTSKERMDEDSLSGGDAETNDEPKDRILRNIWSLDDTSYVTDTLHDVQTLVRSIVVGLKTVIWCINNYRHQREKDKGREPVTVPAGSNEELASAMQRLTNWERGLIDKYITYALPCFKVFQQVSNKKDGRAAHHSTPESIVVASQYRDVLTYFAAAFTVLDSYNFRRTIGTRVDLLLDTIIEDHHVMVIPRHLLGSNQKASFVFAGILLSFLVARVGELSTKDSDEYAFLDPRVDADHIAESVSEEEAKEAFEHIERSSPGRKKRASVILELFERVLKSLATFPDNEAAFRPYLRKIVATCLRSMVERCDGWPDNYCILLRFTFRAISAGKFEESYKELLPLLPTILNGLYRILLATNDVYLRHLIVELCLTVPARLSSLLPHMSLLLRMIIVALKSISGDLVNLG